MGSIDFKRYGNDIVAHDKRLVSEFPVDLFNPEFLSSNSSFHHKRLSPADIKGRGILHLFTYRDQPLVLRHYYRGGMVAEFTEDSYLWRGLYGTRSVSEFRILLTLHRLNLPVPVPVAAHVRRGALTYQADIVTRFIPEATPLSSRLAGKPLSDESWHEIGVVIRRFHDKSCIHADLNAHNILIDEKQRVFLIDFDKASLGKGTATLRHNNVSRLRRSLLKLKSTEPSFGYSERDFKSLMKGYYSGY